MVPPQTPNKGEFNSTLTSEITEKSKLINTTQVWNKEKVCTVHVHTYVVTYMYVCRETQKIKKASGILLSIKRKAKKGERKLNS